MRVVVKRTVIGSSYEYFANLSRSNHEITLQEFSLLNDQTAGSAVKAIYTSSRNNMLEWTFQPRFLELIFKLYEFYNYLSWLFLSADRSASLIFAPLIHLIFFFQSFRLLLLLRSWVFHVFWTPPRWCSQPFRTSYVWWHMFIKSRITSVGRDNRSLRAHSVWRRRPDREDYPSHHKWRLPPQRNPQNRMMLL